VCLYTNTPDCTSSSTGIRRTRSVVVVSACSGHGFKFATAIWEIVADLVAADEPRFDLEMFWDGRFR
jgi:sarcosine oxidase